MPRRASTGARSAYDGGSSAKLAGWAGRRSRCTSASLKWVSVSSARTNSASPRFAGIAEGGATELPHPEAHRGASGDDPRGEGPSGDRNHWGTRDYRVRRCRAKVRENAVVDVARMVGTLD